MGPMVCPAAATTTTTTTTIYSVVRNSVDSVTLSTLRFYPMHDMVIHLNTVVPNLLKWFILYQICANLLQKNLPATTIPCLL